MDPVAFGEVRFGKADLVPIATTFKDVDIDGCFDGPDNIGVTSGPVADVDGRVLRYSESVLERDRFTFFAQNIFGIVDYDFVAGGGRGGNVRRGSGCRRG